MEAITDITKKNISPYLFATLKKFIIPTVVIVIKYF